VTKSTCSLENQTCFTRGKERQGWYIGRATISSP